MEVGSVVTIFGLDRSPGRDNLQLPGPGLALKQILLQEEVAC